MKYILIVSILFFAASCQPQEKSINDGVIVDSLQPKKTLAINAADTLTDSSKLIIPGKSLGNIYLNEPSDSVFSKLGRPNTGDAAMGKSLSIYINKENNTELKIFFMANMGDKDEVPRAKLFYTNSSFFETKNNISVGNKLEEIKKYFPDVNPIALVTLKKDSFQIFDSQKEGVSFDLDNKNICRGITIHTAGEKLPATYLPFYDSFEYIKK